MSNAKKIKERLEEWELSHNELDANEMVDYFDEAEGFCRVLLHELEGATAQADAYLRRLRKVLDERDRLHSVLVTIRGEAAQTLEWEKRGQMAKGVLQSGWVVDVIDKGMSQWNSKP